MGRSGQTREGLGILRLKVAPFAQTDLGANHTSVSALFWSQREAGKKFLLPGKKAAHPPTPSYGAAVASSDRVPQSISSPTTCFIEKGPRAGMAYLRPHYESLAKCLLFVQVPEVSGKIFSFARFFWSFYSGCITSLPLSSPFNGVWL